MSKNLFVQDLTARDLKPVAAIHLAAFPDSALTKLGMSAVSRYYAWQLSDPHEITALGAFIETKLVGFCFGGVFREALAGFLQKNRLFLATHLLGHPWLITNPIVRTRLVTALRIFKQKARSKSPHLDASISSIKSFGILAIAIHPQYQGMGIGRLLMYKVEASAIESNFPKMHLTVHPKNQGAIQFYEGLGWGKIGENGTWNGRMTKILLPKSN